jgi:hypothetical protein
MSVLTFIRSKAYHETKDDLRALSYKEEILSAYQSNPIRTES